MVTAKLMLETTRAADSPRPAGKNPSTDPGAFAQILIASEVNSLPPPENAPPRINDARPADGRDDSSNDRNESGNRTPSCTSDSGQSRRGESGVDGGINGVPPGASTEASVNASPSQDSSSASEPNAAEGTPPDELQAILQQLAETTASSAAAQSAASAENADRAAVTLGARTVDAPRQDFAPNPNLQDQQKIIFETGLAEHFIRLLSDRFGPSGQTVSREASEETSLSAPLSSGPSGSSATGSPPSAGSVPGHDVSEALNRILQIVRSNLGHRQSQMTVQLDPPELGKLRLDVRLIDNTLRLNIITETAEARQVILSRLEVLRGNLERSGVHLTRVEVVNRSADFQTHSDGSPAHQQDSARSNSGGFSHPQGFYHSRSPMWPERDFAFDPEPRETPLKLSTGPTPTRTVNLVA